MATVGGAATVVRGAAHGTRGTRVVGGTAAAAPGA